ncbi:MAG: GTPase, partial [Patescibacteria group bacterium]|nr:GTPase [Patescibacteria group bacterium]
MTCFDTFANELHCLDRALGALAPAAATVGVPPPAGQEWYELLRRRLLPQLKLPPVLIVAVVGGTNIGKSVVFNHLAGEVASAVSPLAAGTKHPVCLAPPDLANPDILGRLFDAFTLRPWTSADESLEESAEDRLFWRPGPRMPERLLLLDAPDVDSDARVNWQRARAVRQSADVLLAVLTQQKYNDAAVKQFVRAAVEADKPIVVVFNQIDLADARYWPMWLDTFRRETGAEPDLVYVVPY